MKRLFLWSCIILFLFSGCSTAQNGYDSFKMDRVVTGAESMASAVEEDSSAYSEEEAYDGDVLIEAARPFSPVNGLVSVSVELYQSQTTAEDGALLFINQVQIPSVYAAFSFDVTDTINSQLDAYRQKKWGEAAQWEEEASLFYEEIQGTEYEEDFYGWSSYASVQPQRVDGSYISLVFFHSEYTGGAHPNNVQSALNFDTSTGGLLSLANVFKAEEKQAVLDILLDRLSAVETTFGLFDGYEETVRESFEGIPVEMAQNWYLTERGIVFFFNPYEISPYAAGVVTVELTYEELQNALREDFMLPAVAISSGGSPVFALNVEEDGYENIARISAGGGAQVALTAEEGSPVYNLRLYQVSMSEGQMVYQRPIYAANRFTAEDLLIFGMESSDDQQSVIGVTYTVDSGEADTVQYLTISDNQITIIDG